jgi:hypothetical protein
MAESSESSILKLCWIFSLVIGVLYILVTIGIAVDPMGMFINGESVEILIKHPLINCLWRILFAIIGVLNIGFINALSKLVRSQAEKWEGVLQWSTIIGIASGIIAALNWIHFVQVADVFGRLYRQGSSFEEIGKMILLPLDPYFIWSWGGFGFCMLILNLVGLKNSKVIKGLGYLGVFIGLDLIFMVISYILELTIDIHGYKLYVIIIDAAVLGLICGPVYHFLFAGFLNRCCQTKEQQPVCNHTRV